jgi:peptidoglycan/LPS O-acetylase OafA/YrhL
VPGLDLLRALAILWVMAYHLTSYGVALPGFVEFGWMGVDLFFVLSGYLVGAQAFALRGQGWGGFMLRRALRVLPAYLAVLGLYLWLPAWRESPGMQPAWQFLSFTANLLPDYANSRAFSHAWSLCVEEHFYLLLPLAVGLLGRRPAVWKGAALAGAILAGGMLVRGLAWQMQVAPHLAVQDAWLLRYVEYIYNPTWARLDGLLVGAVLAAIRLFRPGWWSRLTARPGLLLLAGFAGVAATARLLFDGIGAASAIAGFPLLSLSLGCLLLACAGNGWPARVQVPGARLVATLAFSLYLTHKSAFHLVDSFLDRPAPLAYAAMALACAVLLYLAVERPALALRARLPGRRPRFQPHSPT